MNTFTCKLIENAITTTTMNVHHYLEHQVVQAQETFTSLGPLVSFFFRFSLFNYTNEYFYIQTSNNYDTPTTSMMATTTYTPFTLLPSHRVVTTKTAT